MAAVRALSGYLAGAARRPFGWATFDCLLFIADWVREATGIDPGAAYRGRYTDERSARRLIKARGGIEALLDTGLATAGVARRDGQAVRGDVGLVRVLLYQRGGRNVVVPTGAICVSADMWAVKPAHGCGLVVDAFPLMKAWSLPNG